MSTIKSSAENLTLNADGANNDVIIQSNGSTKITVDGGTGGVGIGTTVANKIFNISDPAQGGEALKLHFEASASSDKFAIYTYDRTNSHYADLSLGQSSLYIHGSGGVVSAQYGIELGSGTDATAANTLDDYEEGTWTPNIGGDATYSNQVGNYIKIGNLVWAHFSMTINVKGTGNSMGAIYGLPFNSGIGSQNSVAMQWANLATAINHGTYYVGASSSTLYLSTTTGSATGLGNNPNIWANGATMIGVHIYSI